MLFLSEEFIFLSIFALELAFAFFISFGKLLDLFSVSLSLVPEELVLFLNNPFIAPAPTAPPFIAESTAPPVAFANPLVPEIILLVPEPKAFIAPYVPSIVFNPLFNPASIPNILSIIFGPSITAKEAPI